MSSPKRFRDRSNSAIILGAKESLIEYMPELTISIEESNMIFDVRQTVKSTAGGGVGAEDIERFLQKGDYGFICLRLAIS
jgi:hypothetical protein